MEASELLIRIDEKLNLLIQRFEDERKENSKRFDEIWRELDHVKGEVSTLRIRDSQRSGFLDGAKWIFGIIGAGIGAAPSTVILALEKM